MTITTQKIFWIALKITGIAALWKFVGSLSGVFTGLGVSFFTNKNLGDNSFMTFVGLNLLINVIIIGFFAYMCLKKTNYLVNLIDGSNEVLDLRTNTTMVYRIVVLVMGCLLIINGLDKVSSYDYKFVTQTTTQIEPGTQREYISKKIRTDTQTKTINYIALAEILLGIFVLRQTVNLSNYLSEWLKEDDSNS